MHIRAIGAFLTYARRGLLLNACAVDPVGGIASVSAIGAFVGAAVMAFLSLLASPT